MLVNETLTVALVLGDGAACVIRASTQGFERF